MTQNIQEISLSNIINKVKTKLIYSHIKKGNDLCEKMTNDTNFDIQNIVESININHKDIIHNCVKEHVLKDIEMFINYDGSKENTIISKFSMNLKGTEHLLKKILEYPVTNIDILSKRQSYYNYLDSMKDDDIAKIPSLMEICKKHEDDIIWLLIEKDEHMNDLFDMIYFKWYIAKPLNSSSYALTSTIFYKILVSPIIGILTPILYVVVPFLVMRYKFKLKVDFTFYVKTMFSTIFSNDSSLTMLYGKKLKWLNRLSYLMSIVFYFQGIFNSLELSKTYNKVIKHISNKIESLSLFINASKELSDILWNDKMQYFYDVQDVAIDNHIPINYTPFSLFSNFGEQLKTFKHLDLNYIKCMLKRLYMLDSIYSIFTFKKDMNCSYSKYLVQDKPIINISEVWHPCISKIKVVKNDISISNDSNAIITGPNAGGKSTFIKALLVNIILSQTIGMTLSNKCEHTLFDCIHSQINLPDNKGYESLFEAEMYRCKNILDNLKENPNYKYLIIMDEIFNSTNPIEGICGAYAIVKNISQCPNTVLLFTTHYTYLTKLQKQTNKFTTFKMNIIRNGDDIQYPYKLEPGISKQYIALELLKKNGFDTQIIEDAISLKQKFIT